MPDLPPDVRDRAARAASKARFNTPVNEADNWRAVVDAVAEVLAAEQQRELYDALRETSRLQFKLNTLQARVDLLTAALTDLLELTSTVYDRPGSNAVELQMIDPDDVRAALSATPTTESEASHG